MKEEKVEEINRLFFEMPLLFQNIKHTMKSAPVPSEGHNKNQIVAIMILGKMKEVTPSALSHYMAMEKGSMTTLIDSLVEKGLVQRALSADDRRKTLLSLTEEGSKHMNLIEEHRRKCFDTILLKLGEEELDELVQSLKVLIKTMHTLATK